MPVKNQNESKIEVVYIKYLNISVLCTYFRGNACCADCVTDSIDARTGINCGFFLLKLLCNPVGATIEININKTQRSLNSKDIQRSFTKPIKRMSS